MRTFVIDGRDKGQNIILLGVPEWERNDLLHALEAYGHDGTRGCVLCQLVNELRRGEDENAPLDLPSFRYTHLEE